MTGHLLLGLDQPAARRSRARTGRDRENHATKVGWISGEVFTLVSIGNRPKACINIRVRFCLFVRPSGLRKLLFAALAGLGITFPARAERQFANPEGPWKFLRQDVSAESDFDGWEDVTVPHTWNALDGQNGKAANPEYPAGYYRGPAWYARKLAIPADWQGNRIFLRFEAVSLVSDIYVNGRHLGEHRGGFGAFAYEITDLVKPGGDNVLRVKADNTRFEDVIPLSGDFTVFGGIYRPVQLFSTGQACITPLYFGTSGVFLTQKRVAPEEAEVWVETVISNAQADKSPLVVKAELLDAAQKIVQVAETEAKTVPGEMVSVRQTLKLKNPHLWNGIEDPYLYQVRVRLLRDGKPVDEVVQPLGLRTVRISEDLGFLLNGKPYPIHGVNRHQEMKDKGWALSESDHDLDLKLILEMGANAVRLAHYPQSGYFLDLLDRAGVIAWEEIPVVEQIRDTKDFEENVRQQMKEMILQGFNHPSIAFWGIFNELNAGWVKSDHRADAVPLLTGLRDMAHEMDPSRPVVAASWTANPLPIHGVPDWQCLNTYPGWYWGKTEEFEKTLTKAANTYGKKRIAVSEYGAGANTAQHAEGKIKRPPGAGGQFHPEEYQTRQHRVQWSQMKGSSAVWGSFVWAMFDFASDHRNEGGQPGINDKGLVTHDRKIKKDAFFFYKANWNPEPMVYIASRRNTPRKGAVTDIEVFTNTSGAELKVNGKPLGTAKPDEVNTCRWQDVALQPGVNTIEVTAKSEGKTLADRCEWTLVP